MPIVYAPDSVLLQYVWTTANFASGGASTTLGFNGLNVTGTDLDDILSLAVASWSSALRPNQDNSITLDRVRVETETFSRETSVGVSGNANRSAPPPNASIVWAKSAQIKGPRGAGRNFWPGFLTEGDIDERGAIASGPLAVTNTALDEWVELMETPQPGYTLLLSLPQSDGGATGPILPWPQVTSYGVRTLCGTQRRRLRR